MKKNMFLLVILLIIFMPAVVSADTDLTIMPINTSNWGDSTLLKSGNEYLLMDVTEAKTMEVLDFLIEKNVKKFDLYLSHYHSDHYGVSNDFNIDGYGRLRFIEYLMVNKDKGLYKDYKYEIGTLYLPDPNVCYQYDDNGYTETHGAMCKHMYEEIFGVAYELGIEIVILRTGTSFTVGNTRAEVLYVNNNIDMFTSGLVPDEDGLTNNSSLVTMFTSGKTKFLSAGDIEIAAENKILELGIDISADIFKLSHHGIQVPTSISNTKEFIDAVNPKYSYFTFVLGYSNSLTYDSVSLSVNNVNEFSNIYAPSVNGNISFVIKNDVITPIVEKNGYSITINYVDVDTDEILDTRKYDFSYDLFNNSVNYHLYDYMKKIEGYELYESIVMTSGILSKDETINIYYKKIPEEKEDLGSKNEPLIENPKTGKIIKYTAVILVLIISVISYILIKRKSKFQKHS